MMQCGAKKNYCQLIALTLRLSYPRAKRVIRPS